MTRVAGQNVAMSETGPTLRARLRELTAEEIRVLLARRRISAAELARRAGMKQSTLARRMTGEMPFDLDELETIADVLGVPVHDLIPRTRPNGGSGSSPVRTTVAKTRPPGRPNGRHANDSRRPTSPEPPSRRRPRPINPSHRPMHTVPAASQDRHTTTTTIAAAAGGTDAHR